MYQIKNYKTQFPLFVLLLFLVACTSPPAPPTEPISIAAMRGLNLPKNWGMQLRKIQIREGLPCSKFTPSLVKEGEKYRFQDSLYKIEEQTEERLSFFAENMKNDGAYRTENITYQWITDFPTPVLAVLSKEKYVYTTQTLEGYKCDLGYSISLWEWSSDDAWIPVTTELLTDELIENFKATNMSFTYHVVDNYFYLNLKKGDEVLVNDLKLDIFKHQLIWNYSSTDDLTLEWVLDKFEIVGSSANLLACYQNLQQEQINQLSFFGRIDNQYDIEMDLVFEKLKNTDCGQWQQIKGRYRYLSKNIDIMLEGEYCQTTNALRLVEYHKDGRVRELFEGSFTEACRIEGNWSLEDKDVLPFYLEQRKDAL